MVIAERIRERIQAVGLSQAELARRVGVAQPTIAKLISGQSNSSAHIHKIARELKTTPEYLFGETDEAEPLAVVDRRLPFHHAPRETNVDMVEVQEIDLAYGLGGTFFDEVQLTSETRPFPRAWLALFTSSSPDQVFFAKGSGDSMMPTIHDSDIVLIDRGRDTVKMRDQIWACALGEVGMIKRLRPNADGSIAILSDNASVSDDRAVDDELFVIGQVIAVVKKL